MVDAKAITANSSSNIDGFIYIPNMHVLHCPEKVKGVKIQNMQCINRPILIVSISLILVFGVEYPIFAGFGGIIYQQANADRNSQPGINGHSDPTSQANGGNGGRDNFANLDISSNGNGGNGGTANHNSLANGGNGGNINSGNGGSSSNGNGGNGGLAFVGGSLPMVTTELVMVMAKVATVVQPLDMEVMQVALQVMVIQMDKMVVQQQVEDIPILQRAAIQLFQVFVPSPDQPWQKTLSLTFY